MQTYKKLFLVALIMLPLIAGAQSVEPTNLEIKEAFKYYKNVTPNISVPKVVEVSFTQDFFALPVFAVYNITTATFEPSWFSVGKVETKSYVKAPEGIGAPEALIDGNYRTYLEFPVSSDRSYDRAEVVFVFDEPITASSLSFALDNYVALPARVSVSAEVNGQDYIVLALTRPLGEQEIFPKTTSAVWRVVFEYVQPLRITEMKFHNVSADQIITRSLRFLAQPGQTYQIYFDADRHIQFTTKEKGNLSSNQGVIFASASLPISNPVYKPADADKDARPDMEDNCISVSNYDQADEDQNGRGDACEDYDRDGILQAEDNCPDVPNRNQEDTDRDGAGDNCDDSDNRLTEKMPWLPWAGIGVAGVVLLGLFIIALKHKNTTSTPEL